MAVVSLAGGVGFADVFFFLVAVGARFWFCFWRLFWWVGRRS